MRKVKSRLIELSLHTELCFLDFKRLEVSPTLVNISNAIVGKRATKMDSSGQNSRETFFSVHSFAFIATRVRLITLESAENTVFTLIFTGFNHA